MLLDEGYTGEAIGMDNPVTHKRTPFVSAPFTLIEARFFCQDYLLYRWVHAGLPPKG